MFRLIGIVVALGLAAVLLEPSWDASQRSLTLRVRSASECVEVVRSLGARVGDRLARAPDEEEDERAPKAESKPPPVAAGPVSLEEKPQERLTDEERAVLDRLIEEKTRED